MTERRETTTLTVELPEELVRSLEVLPGGAAAAIHELALHAAEAVTQPASWERAWLSQVFLEQEWLGKIERDPVRPGCIRPRAEVVDRNEDVVSPMGT